MRNCPCRQLQPVFVHIDADLSHTGQELWREVGIDKCIAPIVKALQRSGINMRSSCCGHGKGLGEIQLSDGRVIIIKPKEDGHDSG